MIFQGAADVTTDKAIEGRCAGQDHRVRELDQATKPARRQRDAKMAAAVADLTPVRWLHPLVEDSLP